ncbi:focal adhesion kinase 1-like [Orbicella faveolata]|uniref:focal adhesion kinase 1-like n=1 Tax=Orbicella faveolata TaxID=48498 RepID=UPI0009E25118|nr:focal adhesion kinase 1-like [Orbicella faveolata]
MELFLFLFQKQLNDYDKLYLLMFKWRIIRLFNPLCYAAGVKSVTDLEQQLLTNMDHVKKKLPSWAQSPSFDEDLKSIQNMIADSKTVKYEDLPELLEIQKKYYKEELEAAGVSIIQKDCVSLQTKIALGRPYSGDVYNAQLTQGDNKIDVVLRYDLDSAQRKSFIREAKILAGVQHEYIMKCFGVVILGSYADSVALVVELFSEGNLEEFRVPSLFHAWLYASQLSSALEYLESKHLVHTSVVEPFVYIASLEKISVGGFMCCCYEEEMGKTQLADYRTISGHQGHRLDDNSFKGVAAMFAHLVIGMFRYLDSHHSSQLLKLFPKRNKTWPLVCPSGVASLLDRCLDKDVNKRPTFQEIHQILAKVHVHNLTCENLIFSSTVN